MKSTTQKMLLAGMIFSGLASCSKSENTVSSAEIATDSAEVVSSAASAHAPGRQFLKTASIDMEVKEVYAATVEIEKVLAQLGGFVTSSNLTTHVLSSETYNTSDTEAMLVRKSETVNRMQVRIPSENLQVFLQNINGQKLFLNARIINAEEVSAKVKHDELEAKRAENTAQNIAQLKNTTDKVKMADHNQSQDNSRQIARMTLEDQIRYSTVEIDLKEPQVRVAQIPVTNIQHSDNLYRFNFLYDAKNAFVEGFYLLQNLMLFLIRIWPLAVLAGVIFFFICRRNIRFSKTEKTSFPS